MKPIMTDLYLVWTRMDNSMTEPQRMQPQSREKGSISAHQEFTEEVEDP